jgi:hypothetical protein
MDRGENNTDKITIDDVILALKILKQFRELYQRVESELRRIGLYQSYRSGDPVLELAKMMMSRSRQQEEEEEVSEEISEEELEKFRKLRDKYLKEK